MSYDPMDDPFDKLWNRPQLRTEAEKKRLLDGFDQGKIESGAKRRTRPRNKPRRAR